MRQGKNDAQVKQFLVDRYGEFVLYKPEVAPGTYIPVSYTHLILPVIRYSVVWWNSLHQGQTIRVFGESSMDDSMVLSLIHI